MKKLSLILLLMVGVGAALWIFWRQREENDRSETNMPILTDHLMKSGLKAANEKNWQKAIDSFRHAHSTCPQLPEPLYNLALAHDRAEHRLVAMCWYEAFLVAAPVGKTRNIVENRIRELDALIRADITKLADAAIEIAIVVAEAEEMAPTNMKLFLASHFRTTALVDGHLGDISHTMAMSERLRSVDPDDGWWLDMISMVLSEVALDLADRGYLKEAEQIAGRMSESQAVQIRQYITKLRESGKTLEPAPSLKDLSPRETIHRWTVYADEIVAGTHHRMHVMDLFAVDPAPRTGPIPEMGIGPYIEAIRWSPAPSSRDVIDGAKRLFLTYQEIRLRRGLPGNSN